MFFFNFARSDKEVARYKINVALAAIKLQERVRTVAYPHANVELYVRPPALAEADYSTIDKLLEGSLIRCTCDTEAIYVRLAARRSNSGPLDFTIFFNLNAC